MKKQYMQPEWKITVLEENFVTTSGETVAFSGFGSFNKETVYGWEW